MSKHITKLDDHGLEFDIDGELCPSDPGLHTLTHRHVSEGDALSFCKNTHILLHTTVRNS